MLSFLQCCYDYREAYNYDQFVAKRNWDIVSSTLESVQNFEWTPEAVSNVQLSFSDFRISILKITSLAILQLPAITLALLGLIRATSRSDVFKALVIACIPFFLLGLLDPLFAFCLQKLTKRGLEKTGLLRFLGSTEEQRALAQDTARAFSGHAIQLLFQVLPLHIVF